MTRICRPKANKLQTLQLKLGNLHCKTQKSYRDFARSKTGMLRRSRLKMGMLQLW